MPNRSSRNTNTPQRTLTREARQARRNRLKWFWRIHRWLGISLVAVLVWMAVTGFLLNRSHDFGFDQTYVESTWVLDGFGIAMPTITNHYATEHVHIAELDNQWYWLTAPTNTKTQPTAIRQGSINTPLLGIVKQDYGYWVSTAQQAWLLTDTGERIETLTQWPPAPTRIHGGQQVRQLGQITTRQPVGNQPARNHQSNIVIELDDHSYWRSVDGLNWQPFTASASTNTTVTWSQVAPSQLPETVQTQLAQAYRAQALSYETVILRLHNASLMGPLGKWLLDVVSLGILLLAISGVYLWIRTRRRRQNVAS